MRTSIARLTLIMALLAPCGTALGQSDLSAETQKDIRKLMELTGSRNLIVQIMNQVLGPVKQAMPNVPEEFWTNFMAKIDTGKLIDMTVPIYAKHFTHEEIKELLAFYQKPIGQKVIATLPAVMQESMLAGQKWGQKLGQQVVEELKAAGYQ